MTWRKHRVQARADPWEMSICLLDDYFETQNLDVQNHSD